MLTAQEIKEKLTSDDIKKLITLLGGEVYEETNEYLRFDTICHSGTSHKLYYYFDIKSFICYTECGNLDIFGLICKVKDYQFHESISWITTQMGWDTLKYGFGKEIELISDWEFINKIKSRKIRREKEKLKEDNLTIYDESILNMFQTWYPREWMNEGISINSMRKYGICYSTFRQQIIIPHRDTEGRLIGVRARNTNENDIEEYGKYTPFTIWKQTYNHPLGRSLFGLDKNKEYIQKIRKVMLVEGEKSVLKCDTYFPDMNFTVALCGGNLTDYQRDIIVSMGVREVVLSLDKEYQNEDEYKKWNENIMDKMVRKLLPYVIVTIVEDKEGLIRFKDSPVDGGMEVLMQLMDKKRYVF